MAGPSVPNHISASRTGHMDARFPLPQYNSGYQNYGSVQPPGLNTNVQNFIGRQASIPGKCPNVTVPRPPVYPANYNGQGAGVRSNYPPPANPTRHLYSSENSPPYPASGHLMGNKQGFLNSGYRDSDGSACNQNYSTHRVDKRLPTDFCGIQNQPSKRFCPDQSVQPYSVQVNGYQEGLHIQGNCYLTVSQQGYGYPASSGYHSPIQSHSPQLQKPAPNIVHPFEGHVDVSVTPGIQNSPLSSPLLMSPDKKNENNEKRKKALTIQLRVVMLAAKHVPELKSHIVKMKRQHDSLCISVNICGNLYKLLKSPEDKKLLCFYVKNKLALCQVLNQKICSVCLNDIKQQESCRQKGTLLKRDSSDLSHPQATIQQKNSCSPLSDLQSHVKNIGGPGSLQSFHNSKTIGYNQSASPYSSMSNSSSPNVSSTFLSESEFRDKPYDGATRNANEICQNERGSSPFIGQNATFYTNRMSQVNPMPIPNSMNNGNPLAARTMSIAQNGNSVPRNVNSANAMNQPPISRFTAINSGVNEGTLPPSSHTGPPVFNNVVVSNNSQNMNSSSGTGSSWNTQTTAMSSTWNTRAVFNPKPFKAPANVDPANPNMCSKRTEIVSQQQLNRTGYEDLARNDAMANYDVSNTTDWGNQVNLQNNCLAHPHIQQRLTADSLLQNQSTRSPVCANDQAPAPPKNTGRYTLPTTPKSLEYQVSPKSSGLSAEVVPNFRQQAASLMKLPESASNQSSPKQSPNPPKTKRTSPREIRNCFSLQPPSEKKPDLLGLPKKSNDSDSSSGMSLPLRFNNDCIVIEDSDEEESLCANTIQPTSAVPKSNVSASSLGGKCVSGDSVERVMLSSKSPTSLKMSNINPIVPSKDVELSASGQSAGVISQTLDIGSIAVAQNSQKGSECERDNTNNIPLSEALKQLDDEESLASLMASGEATFATFVFDEGTGDMEITTAEFGEEVWEQMVKGGS